MMLTSFLIDPGHTYPRLLNHEAEIETLQGPVDFENHEPGKFTRSITDNIHALLEDKALDYQRSYNLSIISMVMIVSPLGLAVLAIACIRIFVHRKDVDVQALVATAFTVASYITLASI